MMKTASNRLYLKGKGIERAFNTLPNYFKVILSIVIISFFLSFLPMKVLLTKDYKTNKYIKSWRIRDKESFTVEYIHSVELTPVSERYIIDGNKIILVESYFKSYGAGLPSTTPYEFEITDKGFRIYDINETMEYLVYRTGAERSNHRLILGDREYVFLEFTEPRSGLEFTVKKISVLRYLIKEVIK